MNSSDTGNRMTEKEKADCLIELHKSQLDHFMQTREIELKVNLSLWTLIVLSGYFLYDKVHLNSLLSFLVYLVIALSLYFVHVFMWMMPIQLSEDTDDHFINQYRRKVEELTGVSIEAAKPKKHLPFLWKWLSKFRTDGWSWIIAETGITLFLLVVLGITLYIGKK